MTGSAQHNHTAGTTITGKSLVARVALWLLLLTSLLLILLISSVPLGVDQQLLFVLAALGLSLLIRPANERARYRVIILILISVIATGRYIYWRLTDSLGWLDPNLHLTYLDYFFSAGLLLAEIYAWAVLYLGFFQTIWPLRRKIAPLPPTRDTWPSVDVFIPTYNEPLKVVAPTILAASRLDWPADKLNIYVLDDGCREEFREFSHNAGVHYIERQSSEGAKAGNINHALARTQGEYVAIFDSDHVPTHRFLEKTMGWFLRDRNLGLIQTPHVFFTPDPLERNLQIFHRVPNEGQLFYGLVQDGNDNWNAAFFCGSCAILSREALDDIGGIATDTVTEDAHTSLLMQKKGWHSAYINAPLAAGLATERLSQHVGQRIRWARGMTQVLRRDNPLFAKGLKLEQRLSYFNAMLHFLFALPRIVFLTAPLAYLFFEAYVIQATAAMIAVYALPHIFQAQVANSVMQGRYRHSFWADVYETVLAPHLVRPTLTALIAPDKGSFNVTSKGGVVPKDEFDWRSSRFIFLLLLLNLAGLVIGVLRFFWLNPEETGTVTINLGWTLYNSIILGAALHVAWEKRQRRDIPRIHRQFDAELKLPSGIKIPATTSDISLVNTSLQVPPSVQIETDTDVTLTVRSKQFQAEFPARVVTSLPRHLGLCFQPMPAEKQADLVYFTHAHDHAWDAWYNACEPSKPMASLWEIIRLGVFGAFRSVFGHSDDPESPFRRRRRRHNLAWLFCLLSLPLTLGLWSPRVSAETPDQAVETLQLNLKQLGVRKPIKLRGGNSQDSVFFALRADRIVSSGELKLRYHITHQILDDYKALAITLNGQSLGEIPINSETIAQDFVSQFTINPLFVSDINDLAFRLVPKDPLNCEKLDVEAISAEIFLDSTITLNLRPLVLVNDLKLFPVPFYDFRDDKRLILPFYLDPQLWQSEAALRAAGLLASWFGAQADYRTAEFPLKTDARPDRHAVIFVTPETQYPFLSDVVTEHPSVTMRSLPDRPYIKLLVISAPDTQGLVVAARALASGQVSLSGPTTVLDAQSIELVKRIPYDAPRWLKDDAKTYFSDLTDTSKLASTGISPPTVHISFRMAPDIHIWEKDMLNVHLNYNYTNLPLEAGSSLDLGLNSDWLKSLQIGQRGLTDRAFWQRQPVSAEAIDIQQIHKRRTTQIPMARLAGINDLSFYFNLILPEEAARECASLYTDNMRTEIDPDSFFDLRGRDHFTRLPDLAKFVNLGFPFTRYADLTESAVVLPNAPQNEEIEIFFNSMGKLGAATGYPVFGLQVSFPADVGKYADRDLILIGTDARQTLLKTWESALPIYQDANQNWKIRGLRPIERVLLWWKGEKDTNLGEAQQRIALLNEDFGIMTGMQSPLKKGRSVVLLFGDTLEKLRILDRALLDPRAYRNIHGDLALVTAQTAYAFRALPSYYVGSLPWLKMTRWFLATHILAMILLFIAISFASALVLKTMLSAWGSKRLVDHD